MSFFNLTGFLNGKRNWWIKLQYFGRKTKISQGWSLTYKRLLEVGRDVGNRTLSLS
jgi:hypothetical protein